MADSTDQAQSLFLNALELASQSERDAYLNAECGGDDDLRAEVEQLLDHAVRLGQFLDPSNEPSPTEVRPLAEQPGDVIGPYKLLQQIGEGGMGVVYMAEQTEPVERRVALKIIKPGMDSRQVIARFEAERQALAMMDHPNIAKVLDAGTTESGRPYFVMELVKGMPVTRYCDEQQLTPKERLELFVPICQAVQHAHQKGIIHRDLKPSNVLVAEYDDHAVPKIIDFGVAKAVSQRLTEKTMFTQYGQIVGTVEYMSPEQAKLNQLDVDTRSDVYSLGVLLYELLTGNTPFDKQRLRSAAFDELLRIIREEEPPRPSVKLSTCETLPSIAASRHIEPHKLSTLVRGELDWIVMKALEKDRSRRYETASSFAADVQHYLQDEAVVACPPSAAYRFRKFARRNKAAIGTTALVAASLIAGIIGTSWQAYEASQERDRAVIAEGNALREAERATKAEGIAEQRLSIVESQKIRIEQEKAKADNEARRANAEAEKANTEAATARAVKEFLLQDLLAQADIAEQAGGEFARDSNIRVRTLLDRAAKSIGDRFSDQPIVEAEIRYTVGSAFLQLGLYDQAASHLERAQSLLIEQLGAEHPAVLVVQNNLANVYSKQKRYDEALTLRQSLVDTQRRVSGAESRRTLVAKSNLAIELRNSGQLDEAESLAEDVLHIRKRLFGDEDPDTISSQQVLADLYRIQKRHAEALRLFESTLQTQREVRGPTHPETLETQYFLAFVHANQRNYAEALPLLHTTLGMQKQALGIDHPDTRRVVFALGAMLSATGQNDRAVLLYRELLDCNPLDVGAYRALGNAFRRQGDVTEALAAFEQADKLASEEEFRPVGYGLLLKQQGEVAEAIKALRDSFEYFARELKRTPYDERMQQQARVACVNLATLLREQGQSEEAVPYLDRAGELGVSDRFFWTEFALCHRELGHDDEYERGCQQVIAEFPQPDKRSVADWGHVSQRLYRLGKYQQAREGLETTFKKRRDDGPSLQWGPRWWYYTLTLAQLGETERAREYYQQLSQLMIEQPPANLQLYEDLQSEAAKLLGVERLPSTNVEGEELTSQIEN